MARLGRGARELRAVTIHRNFTSNPDGSVLIAFGNTRVLCTAVVEERVPPFLVGKGRGWITAEYAMLPASASEGRISRDAAQKGRALEISRLIGRSLRSVVNLRALGERQITIDCDVLQADGGTRTAAITGGFVALCDALATLAGAPLWDSAGERTAPGDASVLVAQCAAVSVGIVGGEVMLDLCYEEDSAADVDLNLVMHGDGSLIEIQGTAERGSFTREQLDAMIDAGRAGIDALCMLQREALAHG